MRKLLSLLFLLCILHTPIHVDADETSNFYGYYRIGNERTDSFLLGFEIEEDEFSLTLANNMPLDYQEDPYGQVLLDWFNRYLAQHNLMAVVLDEDASEDIEVDDEAYIDMAFTNYEHFPASRLRVNNPEYLLEEGKLTVKYGMNYIHVFELSEDGQSLTDENGNVFVRTEPIW